MGYYDPSGYVCEGKYNSYKEIRQQYPDWTAKQAHDELKRTWSNYPKEPLGLPAGKEPLGLPAPKTRLQRLYEKYPNLTKEQLHSRIDDLAEQNSERILMEMEENFTDAHFVQKHGSQTTLEAQLNRAQNAVNPTTGVVERFRNGRIKRPSAATRFFSNREQLNIINKAKQILKNTGSIRQAQKPITFNNPIGEGYKKFTNEERERVYEYGKSYTAQVFFNRDNPNQIITAFPIWGE